MSKWLLSVGIFTLLGATSFAQADCGDCSLLKLREVPAGTQCKTSKGVEFQLVNRDTTGASPLETWKDLSSGLTWYDNLPNGFDGITSAGYNQYEAFTICTLDLQRSLPTIDDFNTAETHGFREVLPNMANNYFWSSSLYPGDSDVAQVFAGYDGFSGYDVRGFNYSVRCVGR
jgi:hypothetical protein